MQVRKDDYTVDEYLSALPEGPAATAAQSSAQSAQRFDGAIIARHPTPLVILPPAPPVEACDALDTTPVTKRARVDGLHALQPVSLQLPDATVDALPRPSPSHHKSPSSPHLVPFSPQRFDKILLQSSNLRKSPSASPHHRSKLAGKLAAIKSAVDTLKATHSRNFKHMLEVCVAQLANDLSGVVDAVFAIGSKVLLSSCSM